MPSPCTGLRVLDLGHGYGAIPGMVLADFGADVLKIEPPEGERFRHLPAARQWNRGKRGVALDLGSREGRAALQRLATSADVVIEAYRPGVVERLGFGYEALAAANPGLVYLSISGFGRDSPLAAYKGYEGIVAAKTGQFVIQNGYRAGGPIYDAVFKCSFGASMLGLIGLLAALHVRDRTGQGQKVESTLVQSNFVYSYDGIQASTPERTRALSLVQGRDPHNVMLGYRIAECADGRWIQSGSAGGRILENLMRALGIDAYFTDDRFRRPLTDDVRDELLAMIDAAYRSRPFDEWCAVLDEHDAAYAGFLTTQEFMDHPQVLHNGLVVDVEDPTVGTVRQIGPLVRFVGEDWKCPGPAPRVGEHTEEVLAEGPERPPGPQPAEAPKRRGALDDVTILDLAMYAAAPGGPGLLCDLGARVIKIEPPQGDPFGGTPSELFFRVNRGKERLAVDLKDPEGQAIVHGLVRDADVVVHNFRPGVAERLAVDFGTLAALNPRLVYVYAASFGSAGPDAHRPAFDPVLSALAGGEVLQAGEGNPPQQRQTTDHSALLSVAAGILLGLRARDQTGDAQNIETTMLGSAAYLFSDDFLRYEGKPSRPVPDAGQHGLGPLYRLYRTAEDGWVFLACLDADEWSRVCTALDREELAVDPRFATDAARHTNRHQLAAALEDALSSHPAPHWEATLQALDVACVVADGTWQELLFGDAGVGQPDATVEFEVAGLGRLRQCGLPITLRGTPGEAGTPEPCVGGQTRPLLEALGYSGGQIDDLRARGVVHSPA